MTGTGAGTGADDYSHDAMLCWDAFYMSGYRVWTGAGCTGTAMDWDGTIILSRVHDMEDAEGGVGDFAGYYLCGGGAASKELGYMRSRFTAILLVTRSEKHGGGVALLRPFWSLSQIDAEKRKGLSLRNSYYYCKCYSFGDPEVYYYWLVVATLFFTVRIILPVFFRLASNQLCDLLFLLILFFFSCRS